jgi:hypothetical protein
MPEPRQWNPSFDPEAASQMFQRAFLTVIAQQIADDILFPELERTILSGAATLEATHQDWVKDESSKYNLKMTVLVLSSYRILQLILPRDEVLALLRTAMIEPFYKSIRQGTAEALDHTPDALAMMATITKQKQRSLYGTGFVFEHERDDANAFLVNIGQCFYHSFFEVNGAPELTPIFCDWDTCWADAIDPARHGLRFERPSTLGYGGDRCRFYFFRVSKKERAQP